MYYNVDCGKKAGSVNVIIGQKQQQQKKKSAPRYQPLLTYGKNGYKYIMNEM